MGLTKNEKAELRSLVSNVRDDRLRGLIFKLLGDPEPVTGADDPPDDPPPRRGLISGGRHG